MKTTNDADGVRATLAAIAQAADDGRNDDYVAIFAPDAVWDIPSGRFVGHVRIRDFLDEIRPTSAQRHVVSNSIIDIDGSEAKVVSDFVFLVHGNTGWSVAAVGRYHDEFRYGEDRWTLSRREVRDQTPAGFRPASEPVRVRK